MRRSGPRPSTVTEPWREVSWSPLCARPSRSRVSCSPAPTTMRRSLQTHRASLPSGAHSKPANSTSPTSAAQGLVLRVDLVGARAHWVTPSFEPRRFDTRRFIAAVPEGQQVGVLSGEADRAQWWPIREIWPAVESGEYMMLPPTAITCRELEGLTVDDFPARWPNGHSTASSRRSWTSTVNCSWSTRWRGHDRGGEPYRDQRRPAGAG